MVKILDPRDAEKKLRLISSQGSHGGTSAVELMREGQARLGVKITVATWKEYFGLLADVVGTDLSDSDFRYMAENIFSNSDTALLDLLDIKWEAIK